MPLFLKVLKVENDLDPKQINILPPPQETAPGLLTFYIACVPSAHDGSLPFEKYFARVFFSGILIRILCICCMPAPQNNAKQ